MDPVGRAGNVTDVHVAMPRLSGLPAYVRPARPVSPSPRLLDPDDLPLEAYRTDEERSAYRAEIETVDARLTGQSARL